MKWTQLKYIKRVIQPLIIGILTFWFPAEIIRSDVDTMETHMVPSPRIWVRNLETTHSVISIFAMPGETLPIRAEIENGNPQIKLKADQGKLITTVGNQWHWQAPDKPGLYTLQVIPPGTQDFTTLNVFVMVPLDRMRNGYLNDYRIGHYPETPLNNDAMYDIPMGFIEVTRQNETTLISPHFQLGQFVCKEGGNYPKYVVLKEKLILKLEHILTDMNAQGAGCETLHIMSGYRTPWYNKKIGNVKFSRHIYGDAADIYLDARPKDNRMDDLNGDKRSSFTDAQIFYNHIELMSAKPEFENLEGGLGLYDQTNFHGPFVHVDTRGTRSRWGIVSE